MFGKKKRKGCQPFAEVRELKQQIWAEGGPEAPAGLSAVCQVNPLGPPAGKETLLLGILGSFYTRLLREFL